MFELSSIDSVLDGLKKGEMIVLLDDPGRENEGDLVMLAEYATPEAIHFMATHGRGLICMPVAKHLADRLKLEPMTQQSTDPHGTAFTVSIDLNNGSTGISAYDRSATIKHAVSEQAKSEDFIRPGHMFPLIAREGLLATRRGHTEASIALANLCGSAPAAVICEILKSDGQMARGADLKVFCETHQLKMTTIEALVAFLENAPESYHFEPAVNLPTAHGNFQLTAFYQDNKDMPHLILHTTDLSPQNVLLHPHKNVPLVRIHSECMTGDVFGSRRCECGEQLEASMKAISEYGTGMIIYLRQEGRGIGLVEKLKAYKLQEAGYDTVNANLMLGHKADARVYGAANAALKYFGIEGVELMSGNPEKAKALEASGITIHRHVPIAVTVTDENYHYLETKAEFFKHTIVFKQPS